MAAILSPNVPAGVLSTAPDALMQNLSDARAHGQTMGQAGAQVLQALGGSDDPILQDAINSQIEVSPRDQGMMLAAPSTRSLPQYLRTSDADLYQKAREAKGGNDAQLKQNLRKEYDIRRRDGTLGLPGALPMTPRTG